MIFALFATPLVGCMAEEAPTSEHGSAEMELQGVEALAHFDNVQPTRRRTDALLLSVRSTSPSEVIEVLSMVPASSPRIEAESDLNVHKLPLKACDDEGTMCSRTRICAETGVGFYCVPSAS